MIAEIYVQKSKHTLFGPHHEKLCLMPHVNNKDVDQPGPGYAKTCLMLYANNNGAGQPARMRSLISTFVVLCLNGILCILAVSKVQVSS